MILEKVKHSLCSYTFKKSKDKELETIHNGGACLYLKNNIPVLPTNPVQQTSNDTRHFQFPLL